MYFEFFLSDWFSGFDYFRVILPLKSSNGFHFITKNHCINCVWFNLLVVCDYYNCFNFFILYFFGYCCCILRVIVLGLDFDPFNKEKMAKLLKEDNACMFPNFSPVNINEENSSLWREFFKTWHIKSGQAMTRIFWNMTRKKGPSSPELH